MKNIVIIFLTIIAIGSLLGNVLLYQRYSTQRPLMRIGTETISIKDYRDRLDYEYGKPVLNKMAYTILVLQEAKKAGVLPTDDDVNKRVESIRRRTPKVLEEATANPAKMVELKRSLMADIALENLAIKDIKVSDAELKTFYSENRNAFGVPAQARTTIVVAQNAVDANTARALLKDKTMSTGVIASQPRLAVVGVNGFQPNWNAVPTSVQEKLAKSIFTTPVGGISTVQAGSTIFVVRVDGIANSGISPLEKIKNQVERAAKMKKAPSQQVILARLYKNTKISFEVEKYKRYFEDMDDFSRQSGGADQIPAQSTQIVSSK